MANLKNSSSCQCCEFPPGEETLRNRICMTFSGRVQGIDFCIHKIVAALNSVGIRTVASCCGHGKMKGNIVLEDGRALIVQQQPESTDAWRKAIKL